MVPQSYEEWVDCITISCKIDLTVPYINERLGALRDPSNAHTKRYTQLYGEPYLEQVIGWFEQALSEKNN